MRDRFGRSYVVKREKERFIEKSYVSFSTHAVLSYYPSLHHSPTQEVLKLLI